MSGRSLRTLPVLLCRLTLWGVAAGIAPGGMDGRFAPAWRVPACAFFFGLLWALPRRRSEDFDTARVTRDRLIEPDESVIRAEPDRLTCTISLWVDLGAAALLADVTGGLESPFLPIGLFVVVEACLLLGARNAGRMAFVLLLMYALQYRSGLPVRVTSAAAIDLLLLGLSGLLLCQAGRKRQEMPASGATLLAPRTVATLEREIEEINATYRALKETYREVAHLHRDQRIAFERSRARERLLIAHLQRENENGSLSEAGVSLLEPLLELLNAGGAVLWLRDIGENTLRIRVSTGQVPQRARRLVLPEVGEMTAYDVLEYCRDSLQESASIQNPLGTDGAAAPSVHEASDAQKVTAGSSPGREPTAGERHGMAMPALVTLLFSAQGEEKSRVLGAVGLCAPRRQAGFFEEDREFLDELAETLQISVMHLEARRRRERAEAERALAREADRLLLRSADTETVARRVLSQLRCAIPFENATLFLWNTAVGQVEPCGTEGRFVNLLAHLRFPCGDGVAGWVAGQRKALALEDLQAEHRLHEREIAPAGVRSFAALPLHVSETPVGVLLISHTEPCMFSPETLQWLQALLIRSFLPVEAHALFPGTEPVYAVAPERNLPVSDP